MILKNYTLLIIDDDLDDHYLIEDALVDLDVNVSLYFYLKATTALKDLEHGKVGIPNVIITDINMPLMNGLDFLEKIKGIEHLKHIPVIMHSTSRDLKTKEKSMNLGAYKYVTKDSNLVELLETLKTILI